MDLTQIFTDEEVKEEFLDRFPELTEHAPGGGLEGLDGGVDVDRAAEVAESMAEGHYQPGSDRGLEAIIERFSRPVYLVQSSTFTVPPDQFPDSEAIRHKLEGARAVLEAAMPSTGRIDVRNHRLDWVGTGWVVGPDLVVTNRHVASEFAHRDDGGFAFRRNLDGTTVAATLDWRHELGSGEESRFRVREVVWMEPDDSVDVAVLRIATEGEDGEPVPPPITLMTEEEIQAILPGGWVAVIGYPAFDSRNDVADQQRIFDGHFNVKRLAPGQVTFFANLPVLHHDATTLGGNSGSVVLDLERGKAAALHFGGIQGQRNEAVTASRVGEILTDHAGWAGP